MINILKISLIISLIGSIVTITSALDVFYPSLSLRELALGGPNFLLDDENSRPSLLNFDNPAGLMFENKENRLDLGLGYEKSFSGQEWLSFYSPSSFKGWTHWFDDKLVLQTNLSTSLLISPQDELDYQASILGVGTSIKTAYQFEAGPIIALDVNPSLAWGKDYKITYEHLSGTASSFGVPNSIQIQPDQELELTGVHFNTALGIATAWDLDQAKSMTLHTGLLFQVNPSSSNYHAYAYELLERHGYISGILVYTEESSYQDTYITSVDFTPYHLAAQLLFETHERIEVGIVGERLWRETNIKTTTESVDITTISGRPVSINNSISTTTATLIEQETTNYNETTLYGFVAIDVLKTEVLSIRLGASQAYQWSEEDKTSKIISDGTATTIIIDGDGNSNTTTSGIVNIQEQPSKYYQYTRDRLNLNMMIKLFDRILISGSYHPQNYNKYNIGIEAQLIHGILFRTGFNEWEHLSAGLAINFVNGSFIEITVDDLLYQDDYKILSAVKIVT